MGDIVEYWLRALSLDHLITFCDRFEQSMVKMDNDCNPRILVIPQNLENPLSAAAALHEMGHVVTLTQSLLAEYMRVAPSTLRCEALAWLWAIDKMGEVPSEVREWNQKTGFSYYLRNFPCAPHLFPEEAKKVCHAFEINPPGTNG